MIEQSVLLRRLNVVRLDVRFDGGYAIRVEHQEGSQNNYRPQYLYFI